MVNVTKSSVKFLTAIFSAIVYKQRKLKAFYPSCVYAEKPTPATS